MGFRSGLEQLAAEQLDREGVDYEYEGYNCLFDYYTTVPNGCCIDIHFQTFELPSGIKVAQRRRYTCDFRITREDGTILYVETKGYFKSADRTKHKELKRQYPEIDLRIVFSNNGWWQKNKRKRYSDWAEQHGIPYHITKKKDEFIIPEEWYTCM